MTTSGEIRRAKQKAVGGKRDRCRKGKSCSATCISGWKACLVEMSDAVSSSLAKAKSSLSGKIYEAKTKAKLLIPEERKKFQKSLKGDYERVRGKLQDQLNRAVLRGNRERVDSLKRRLDRLESGAGAKLKMPKSPTMTSEKEERLRARKAAYSKALDKIITDMETAASKGKLGTYDRLERALMTMQRKLGPRLRPNDHVYNRREIWNDSLNKKFRERNRYNSFVKARNKLVMALEDAAKAGDQKKYAKLEKAILKAEDRANKSLGLSKTFKKRELWIGAQVRVARERTLDEMFKAMAAGDRAKYDKLERRLGRFEDKLELRNKSSPTPGEFWTKNKGLAQFMGNLEEKGIKNGREGVEGIKLKEQIAPGGHMLGIESSVLGNKLKINVSPDSLSFTVNDSYVSKGDLPRRDTVAITREVMRQFDIVTSSLREGTVLQVSAARGDGREDMREDAYIKFGFSPPDRWGDMYGRVENGKIVPIEEDEYNAGHKARFRE